MKLRHVVLFGFGKGESPAADVVFDADGIGVTDQEIAIGERLIIAHGSHPKIVTF
jgi:hypothetical protein